MGAGYRVTGYRVTGIWEQDLDFVFQPVLHNLCIKGHGMYYSGMEHIKYSLLLKERVTHGVVPL